MSDLPSIDRPSSARIYDYALGGSNNYAIDREFAKRQFELLPDLPRAMRSNRAFIGRAVKFALDQGIRQFIDIGSGLPSQGQAHEIADSIVPGEARVVYIDKEPIAHAHSKILLGEQADPERHEAIVADFSDIAGLWQAVQDTGVIRPSEPTALLVTAILHFFFPEQEPEKALEFCRDRLAPGSLLVLTHGSNELENEGATEVEANYTQTTDPIYLRSRDEFSSFFGDWPLVEPGLVWAVEWRPDGQEEEWWDGNSARCYYLAGVAVKS